MLLQKPNLTSTRVKRPRQADGDGRENHAPPSTNVTPPASSTPPRPRRGPIRPPDPQGSQWKLAQACSRTHSPTHPLTHCSSLAPSWKWKWMVHPARWFLAAPPRSGYMPSLPYLRANGVHALLLPAVWVRPAFCFCSASASVAGPALLVAPSNFGELALPSDSLLFPHRRLHRFVVLPHPLCLAFSADLLVLFCALAFLGAITIYPPNSSPIDFLPTSQPSGSPILAPSAATLPATEISQPTSQPTPHHTGIPRCRDRLCPHLLRPR